MGAMSIDDDWVEFEDLRVGRVFAIYRGELVTGLVRYRLGLAYEFVKARGLPLAHETLAVEVWGEELRKQTDRGAALMHAIHETVRATRAALHPTHLDIHAVYGTAYRIGPRGRPSVKKGKARK